MFTPASFPQHVHMIRYLLDEGQEQRTVQTALVEILGRDVRGRHNDGAEFEKFREQPPQDHRVGDVGDVKFVETQQPCLVEDRMRRPCDDVAIGDFATRDVLTVAIDAL